MKQAPTRSEARTSDADVTGALRAARAALTADFHVRGAAYGAALADVLDNALGMLLTRGLDDSGGDRVAVVALGSYARRELCPGSDVDVLLVLGEARRHRARARTLAERLWYPLWDAGFVTGHAARTIRDSLRLADEDLDALTALLHVRYVAGDEQLAAEIGERARARAAGRAVPVLEQLAGAAEMRRTKPGMVAEMLEPNLKEGAGGLRDLQALSWIAPLLGLGAGRQALASAGVVERTDVERLDAAEARLLDLRVALHRVNGGRSDLMALQDQDAVAGLVGALDADALVRDLAAASRAVAWIARDVWQQVAPDDARQVRADGAIDEALAVVNSRLTFGPRVADPPQALDMLGLAAAAARYRVPIANDALARLGAVPAPQWSRPERDAFVALLRAGRDAVPVFEALDHVGALTRVLPEWEHVRFLPQRNAYHRFTVDRHLLEAVAECAALLDAAEVPAAHRPFDGVVARALRRRDLLLLGALLHDIGKGLPGDHSAGGAEVATRVARRMRLDTEAVEILGWLVRDHLLMADTSTRRDLSDEAMVRRFCDALAGDPERLRLLYLLTVGDSIATGPAAWSQAKAALVRDLFVKAAAIVERDSAESVAQERRAALAARIGEAAAEEFLALLPPAYLLAFDADVMVSHRTLLEGRGLRVACSPGGEGRLVVTVAAPDRTGLLATVAGALTCCGLAVHEASLFTTTDGMALDVFRADDTFGRHPDGGDGQVRATLARAFGGELDVAAGVEERRRHYRRPGAQGGTVVSVDFDASDSATVIEVHADDQVGLLYRLACAFSELELDVTVAKVATLGDRVVDTFYVRDARGGKLLDAARLGALEERIRAAT